MKYIAYYRVSTKGQGRSGLGLDAQRTAVQNYLKSKPGEIVVEYQEIESGNNNSRPVLSEAIKKAKALDATLLIAKLDRLSRNVAFIFKLRDEQVNFVCADLPDANTMTIGIFATMAQHERELISQRTKSALSALKAKGVKLGKPENLTDYSRQRSIETKKRNAANNENWKRAAGYISTLRATGSTFQQIATTLNNEGFKTAKNALFTPTTVRRLLVRAY